MVKDIKAWEEWQRRYLRNKSTDFLQRLQLLEEMRREARVFKQLPSSNPLDGLDLKIKIAKTVNV